MYIHQEQSLIIKEAQQIAPANISNQSEKQSQNTIGHFR